MPLPVEVTTFTVTGHLIEAVGDGVDLSEIPDGAPDDVPCVGWVTFTPNLPAGSRVTVVTATPKAIVIVKPVAVELNSEGSFVASLVDPDNDALNPRDWSWTVSFNLNGSQMGPLPFLAPDGDTIDLTDILDLVPVAASAGVVFVTGPAGAASTVPGPQGPAITDENLAIALGAGVTKTALDGWFDPLGAAAAVSATTLDLASTFALIAAATVTAVDDTILGLSDVGSVVEVDKATAVTVTVAPQADVAWQAGAVVEVFQHGAGQVTVAPGAGVTLLAPLGNKTAMQYGAVHLRRRAADEWVLTGDATT